MVDVICGGSPCQDLSVAGKRAGLAGERSGLFMEQIRLIKEMRDECIKQLCMRGTDFSGRDIRPRYMVWENVPGAFSSNGGEDFRAVLEETARIVCEDAIIPGPSGKWTPSGCIMGDGWSIAWRVHDAQFWGVPQRRKRIALVADFGGESAPEILFEREGVSGDSESGNQEREETSGAAGAGPDKAISFQERAGCEGGGKGILIQRERTGALSTLNNQSVCYGISSYTSNAMLSANPNSGIYETDTSRTLDLNGGNPACNQGGVCVCFSDVAASRLADDGPKGVHSQMMSDPEGNFVLAVDQGGGKSSCSVHQDISPTLATTHQGEPAVCYGVDMYNQTQSEETTQALRSSKADSDHIPCCYGLDRASFNQGQNAKYDFSIEEELAQTLVAKGPGGVTQLSVHCAQETTKE